MMVDVQIYAYVSKCRSKLNTINFTLQHLYPGSIPLLLTLTISTLIIELMHRLEKEKVEELIAISLAFFF